MTGVIILAALSQAALAAAIFQLSRRPAVKRATHGRRRNGR
jgi:hypothetical protein